MKRDVKARRRTVLGFLGAVPGSLVSVRSQAQSERLELSSYFLGPALVGKGVTFFADRISESSAGKLEISVETVAPTMPFHMLGEASTFAHYYAPEFANIEPVLGLSALPVLAATLDEAETLLRIARPFYQSVLARHGQILLATEPWRPAALWSTFPIRSFADLEGIRFAPANYVAQRAGWKRLFERLGVQDASFFDAELMVSSGDGGNLKFAQEFGCFMELCLAVQLNFLTVSREAFDARSVSERDMIEAAGRDTELDLWSFTRELVRHGHREMAKRGVSVTANPPSDVLAAFRRAAEPDVQDWVRSAGPDGTAILADYHRAVGRE